jgi:hypothetical protein
MMMILVGAFDDDRAWELSRWQFEKRGGEGEQSKYCEILDVLLCRWTDFGTENLGLKNPRSNTRREEEILKLLEDF